MQAGVDANEFDDGFESDEEILAQKTQEHLQDCKPQEEKVHEWTMKMLGPGIDLPNKSYSLQPDILTG